MNKNIWIYWNKGFEDASDVVKDCLRSWKYYNPLFKVNELTDNNLNDFLDNIERPKTIQAWSDVLRINILKKHGGLWVDATVLCNKPLEEWIEPHIEKGFFAFSDPQPGYKVCSWFLYSEKENYITEEWHKEVTNYWKNRSKAHHYFWFHSLFNELYQKNNAFKTQWDNTKKYKANFIPASEDGSNPHYFAPYTPLRLKTLDEKTLKAPTYKLRHGSSDLLTRNEIYKNLIGKMK